MFSFLFCLLETAATRKTVNFLFFVIFLLENSLKKIRATIRLQLNGNTELARPVVVMMAQTKLENFHFDNQSKQVVFCFFASQFSKRHRRHVLHFSKEHL